MKKFMKILVTMCLILAISIPNVNIKADTKPSLDETKLTLSVGATRKICLKNSSGNITWESKNKSVAIVNKNGNITAKGIGTTKIIAKNNGNKYYCKVTVKQYSDYEYYASYGLLCLWKQTDGVKPSIYKSIIKKVYCGYSNYDANKGKKCVIIKIERTYKTKKYNGKYKTTTWYLEISKHGDIRHYDGLANVENKRYDDLTFCSRQSIVKPSKCSTIDINNVYPLKEKIRIAHRYVIR